MDINYSWYIRYFLIIFSLSPKIDFLSKFHLSLVFCWFASHQALICWSCIFTVLLNARNGEDNLSKYKCMHLLFRWIEGRSWPSVQCKFCTEDSFSRWDRLLPQIQQCHDIQQISRSTNYFTLKVKEYLTDLFRVLNLIMSSKNEWNSRLRNYRKVKDRCTLVLLFMTRSCMKFSCKYLNLNLSTWFYCSPCTLRLGPFNHAPFWWSTVSRLHS